MTRYGFIHPGASVTVFTGRILDVCQVYNMHLIGGVMGPYLRPQPEGERMKYRVHRFEVDLNREETSLEKFLNGFSGEVVSVIPLVQKPSLAWIYGLKGSVNSVVVVEKVA